MTPIQIANLKYELAELRAENSRLREQLGTEMQVSSRQIAERLGVTVRTIWRMVKEGRLPQPIRYNRKIVRWN